MQTYYTVIRYNQNMRSFPFSALANRLILLAILICALNLSARPQKITRNWELIQDVYQTHRLDPAAARRLYSSLQLNAQAAPWRQDLWHAAGIYALWAGEWQAGLDLLEVIQFKGLDASEWRDVGDAYLQTGQTELAESAWRQSLSLEDDASVYRRLYDLHLQKADQAAVLADLQALTRLEPENDEFAYPYVLRLAASDPQKALDFLEKRAGFGQGFQANIESLQQKLRLATLNDSPAAQILIAGQGLAEIGSWELAVEAFQQSIRLETGYAEAWAFLGEAYQQIEPAQPQAALSALHTALSLNPKSISTLTMLALYWQRQGDYQRAAGLFHSAAENDPNNPAWLAALAGLASLQGNLPEAEAYYAAALELAPRQPFYYNLLANFYIQNQVQIEEKALPIALQAVEIDPADPESQTTLAQIYLLLSKEDQAVPILQAVVAQAPDYAKAHYLLGLVYIYRSQTDLAYGHLILARENAQDEALLEQAQRALSYYFP